MTPVPTALKLKNVGFGNAPLVGGLTAGRNEYLNCVFDAGSHGAKNSGADYDFTKYAQKSMRQTNFWTIFGSIGMALLSVGPAIATLFKGKGKNTEAKTGKSEAETAAMKEAEELSQAAKSYKKASPEQKEYLKGLLQREISDAKEVVRSYEASKAAAQKDIDAFTTEVPKLQGEVTKNGETISQSEKTISEADADISMIKSQMASEKDPGKKAQMEIEISKLECKKEEANKKKGEAKLAQDKAQEQIKKLTEANEKAKTTIKEADKMIAKMNKKISQTEEILATSTEKKGIDANC